MQNITDNAQLNSMTLKDARTAIVRNLISKWENMDRELDSLNQSLVEYEEKLKAAREDGDTSENSAYEQAIDNLSITQNNIYKMQKAKYDMSLINEPDFVAATHADDYIDAIDVLKNTREISGLSDLAFHHFDGDISKLATCSRDDMKKLMFKLNYFISRDGKEFDFNESEQEVYELLKEVMTKYKTRPYKPCGKVVLYSTVRVLVNDELYTLMIYPDDVSYIREGIIASNSELASKLLNNEVGDSNIIRDGLRYTIREIY